MIKTELGLISLDVIDSTNNYAMQLINDDKAHHGLTVLADHQTHGKGQRGRVWQGGSGESLLMSVIIVPKHSLLQQFVFSAGVAAAIANVLQKYAESKKVEIKWPNDLIVSDKKAGGILIENVLQGSKWAYSVVGLGINVCQDKFTDELHHATSLKIETNKEIGIKDLCTAISSSIVEFANACMPTDEVISNYNAILFKRNRPQQIVVNNIIRTVMPLQVLPTGVLQVLNHVSEIEELHHGEQVWVWDN